MQKVRLHRRSIKIVFFGGFQMGLMLVETLKLSCTKNSSARYKQKLFEFNVTVLSVMM